MTTATRKRAHRNTVEQMVVHCYRHRRRKAIMQLWGGLRPESTPLCAECAETVPEHLRHMVTPC